MRKAKYGPWAGKGVEAVGVGVGAAGDGDALAVFVGAWIIVGMGVGGAGVVEIPTEGIGIVGMGIFGAGAQAEITKRDIKERKIDFSAFNIGLVLRKVF